MFSRRLKYNANKAPNGKAVAYMPLQLDLRAPSAPAASAELTEACRGSMNTALPSQQQVLLQNLIERQADCLMVYRSHVDNLSTLAYIASAARLKLLLVTLELDEQMAKQDTLQPLIQDAARLLQSFSNSTPNDGPCSMIVVRHGPVQSSGDQDNQSKKTLYDNARPASVNLVYEITNASSPCSHEYVSDEVLTTLIPEILNIQPIMETDGPMYTSIGIGNSDPFAEAYLTTLRESGLSLNQEVSKCLRGNMQRMRDKVAHYRESHPADEENIQLPEDAAVQPMQKFETDTDNEVGCG
jgi:hypothetical protein